MLRNRISTFHINDKAVPAVLLFVTLVSFGLLTPWLGFYWDDWPVIYMAHTQGIKGFWDFYQYDRPFSAWTYILLAPILGTRSIVWYLFVLSLRWLTAVFVWLVLKTIWPRKIHQVFWVALLFAACPLFVQQQIVVAYSQHWICYLFYFISLFLMLKAHEEPHNYFRLTCLAVFLEIVHLFTMEYFLGLELLRIPVLWLYYRVREQQAPNKKVFGFALKHAQVYFAVWLLYLIWRLFFLHLPENNVNDLVLLKDLFQTPLQTIIDLIGRAFQDCLYLLMAWIVSVNPVDIDLRRPFSLAVLAVISFAFICCMILLKRYRQTEINEKDDGWHVQFFAFGMLATLLGMLPVWAIGRQVTLGGDRFSLAAMFGVCVILVSMLEWLSSRHHAKIIMVCLLLTLAIHIDLYNAKAYQYSWDKQRTFFWQLFWRAPYIQPGTPIIADGELLPYVGRYSTSMGIALLYPPSGNPQDVPYWVFNYWEGLYRNLDELVSGVTIRDNIRNYSFSGESKQALLIDFVPENSRCLAVFSLHDVGIKEMPASLEGIISISDLAQIAREPILPNWTPPKNIFGSEPEHTWCFYYQKAKLAGQYQDWRTVIQLLQKAEQLGYSPGDEREYLGFVNAYIQLGEFEKAFDLTLKIKNGSNRNDDNLCYLWSKNSVLKQSIDFITIHAKVMQKLNCVN